MPLCQQLAVGIHPVSVLLVVVAELVLDSLVEIRKIPGRHMAGVVLQHGRCHFLVECQIPFIAVVLELHILFLGVVFRSLQLDGSARKVEGSLEKL